MYRVIASDLDGTLLTPEHIIAPYSRNVLQQLHQRGEHFVFATGRHHHDVAKIRDNVGIPAYMITSNGARVHDAENTLIFSADVEADVIKQVLSVCSHHGNLMIHLYQSDVWLVNYEDDSLIKFNKESGFTYQLFDTNNPPLTDVAKVFITHNDHDELVELENQLLEACGDNAAIAFSTPFCLEVMAANVSKGIALQAVAERLGFGLTDCIAFGDGMNDQTMLEMAGKGLIMGTAHDRLKAALPDHQIIGSNTDEAVAHYLAEHLLNLSE